MHIKNSRLQTIIPCAICLLGIAVMLSNPNVTASQAGWGSIALVAVTFGLLKLQGFYWLGAIRSWAESLGYQLTQIQFTGAGDVGLSRDLQIVTVWVKEGGRIRRASLRLISGPFGLSPPRIKSVTWEDERLAEGGN
jgi:hypothetical protein